MADFDYAGAANATDAGGEGAMPVPPPRSLPSVAAPPAPAPQAPPEDPRYAAALAALQPKPVAPWQQALRSIAPILGTLFAMRQNAGGAFTNAWQQGEQHNQQLQDEEAQRQLKVATILHQQRQERQAAENADLAERRRLTAEAIAAKKLDAQAIKERETKRRQDALEALKTVEQGITLRHANDVAAAEGKAKADDYLTGFHTGLSDENGLPLTLKDLVEKYGVRNKTTGEIALGKTATPKEEKIGSLEDVVGDALDIERQRLGRPLSQKEALAVKLATKERYTRAPKDPDDLERTRVLKDIQIDLAKQEKERRQQVIDQGYQDKFGGAPQIFQHEDGTIHGYIYDKTNHKLIEIPTVIPPGSSRVQPPSAWQKFMKSIGIGGTMPSPPIKSLGGGTDPSDPNWGKQ